MCDTLFLKKDGKSYFGKNSDRSPNEAHLMIREPAKDYAPNQILKTTYIEIPQAEHTNACVLLKPYWIWGAEMGWNEYGLNIGNEAVFTKVKRGKNNGLIGMDLLRLALERCKNSSEVVELIVSLIEKYGQTGSCKKEKNFYYDNSFLIADGNQTFVLETAGKYWVVKGVDNSETISNCLSIKENYLKSSTEFSGNFKKTFQNNLITAVAGAENRRMITNNILSEEGEPISLLKKALRTHADEKVNINKSSTKSVCMHAGNLFGDHTTGSYVGEIDRLYFVTGSSLPCMSIFKPVSPLAKVFPEDEKIALQYWLKHELLNRHLMSGNIEKEIYLKKVREIEEKYYQKTINISKIDELEKLSEECFKEEKDLIDEFLKQVEDKKIKIQGGWYFKHYWKKQMKGFLNEYKL